MNIPLQGRNGVGRRRRVLLVRKMFHVLVKINLEVLSISRTKVIGYYWLWAFFQFSCIGSGGI